MPKRKERPLSEHSDAEVLTLIAWGKVRIDVLKQQQTMVEADIKKWRKVLRNRKKAQVSAAPAPRKVLFPPSHLKTSVPRSAIRKAVQKVVAERAKKR